MSRIGVGSAWCDGAWVAGDVDVIDGVVVAVGCMPPVGTECAVPGFVDLQVNGFAGFDLRRAERDGYRAVADALALTGVTAFAPTVYSTDLDTYVDALATIATMKRSQRGGAQLLGAHLEGPFLNPLWAGAHDRDRLIAPDLQALSRLLAAGPVALMTLAPELPGADEVMSELVARGITVSIGHSDADAECVHRAVDNGATMLTHCFNAHRRFSGRDPGPAGVALSRTELHPAVIADGVHVADDAVRMVFAAAGDRVVLTTDAIAAAGSDDGVWAFDGAAVTVSGNRATLPDGTLAGSVASMDMCLRHLVGLGIDPGLALTAASTTPARLVGLDQRLVPGAPAQVAVLDDHWNVVRTIIGSSVI